eukprot:19899-Amphidinium_carterae.1
MGFQQARTEEDILECLKMARISPIVSIDGKADLQFTQNGTVVRPGLDDVRDWQKDLSPGQKQRLAFARWQTVRIEHYKVEN